MVGRRRKRRRRADGPPTPNGVDGRGFQLVRRDGGYRRLPFGRILLNLLLSQILGDACARFVTRLESLTDARFAPSERTTKRALPDSM